MLKNTSSKNVVIINLLYDILITFCVGKHQGLEFVILWGGHLVFLPTNFRLTEGIFTADHESKACITCDHHLEQKTKAVTLLYLEQGCSVAS